MAGFVAENVLTGKVVFASWDALEKNPDALLLDIREDAERLAFVFPKALEIPLGQLRYRLNDIDRNRMIIVFCTIGVRSYNAARILMENGFKNVFLYPAGSRFYVSTHYKAHLMDSIIADPVHDSGYQETANVPKTAMRIDCSGMQCPGPIRGCLRP
jgi:rhodanese-related sulfurtransferase